DVRNRSADAKPGAAEGALPFGRLACRIGSKRPSRHHECNDALVDGPTLDAVARHGFDDGPVPAEQGRGLVDVRRVYPDAASPPFTAVRDLKEEAVAIRLPIALNRDSFLSHSAIPSGLRRTVAACD